MGQLFHLFESPNRFGLYTLHVWAWKDRAESHNKPMECAIQFGRRLMGFWFG
jgi:hypothetical protein